MRIICLLVLNIILIQIIAQPRKFVGGLLLNFNGIEFKGSSSQFWNSSRNTVSIEGTLGSSVGMFVNWKFNKEAYSRLELRYIEKGSFYEYLDEYGLLRFETIDLNYIEIPLLLGYKFKSHKRTIYLESGLAYANLFSSNIDQKNLSQENQAKNENHFKNTDYSWIVCLRFPIIKKWKENLLFGLRTSYSILPIHKDVKIYNFDYGIELNYLFNN